MGISHKNQKDDFIEYNLEGASYRMPLPKWWYDVETDFTEEEIKTIAFSYKKEERFRHIEKNRASPPMVQNR